MDPADPHELSGKTLLCVSFGRDVLDRAYEIVLDFDGLHLTATGTVSYRAPGEDVPMAVDVATHPGRLTLAPPLLACLRADVANVHLRAEDLTLTFATGLRLTFHAAADDTDAYRVEQPSE